MSRLSLHAHFVYRMSLFHCFIGFPQFWRSFETNILRYNHRKCFENISGNIFGNIWKSFGYLLGEIFQCFRIQALRNTFISGPSHQPTKRHAVVILGQEERHFSSSSIFKFKLNQTTIMYVDSLGLVHTL